MLAGDQVNIPVDIKDRKRDRRLPSFKPGRPRSLRRVSR